MYEPVIGENDDTKLMHTVSTYKLMNKFLFSHKDEDD